MSQIASFLSPVRPAVGAPPVNLLDPLTPQAQRGIEAITGNLQAQANRQLEAARIAAQAGLAKADIDARQRLQEAELENRMQQQTAEAEQLELGREARTAEQESEQQFQTQLAQEAQEFTQQENQLQRAFEERLVSKEREARNGIERAKIKAAEAIAVGDTGAARDAQEEIINLEIEADKVQEDIATLQGTLSMVRGQQAPSAFGRIKDSALEFLNMREEVLVASRNDARLRIDLVARNVGAIKGGVRAVLDEGETLVRERLVESRVVPVPLPPRGALREGPAQFRPERRLMPLRAEARERVLDEGRAEAIARQIVKQLDLPDEAPGRIKDALNDLMTPLVRGAAQGSMSDERQTEAGVAVARLEELGFDKFRIAALLDAFRDTDQRFKGVEEGDLSKLENAAGILRGLPGAGSAVGIDPEGSKKQVESMTRVFENQTNAAALLFSDEQFNEFLAGLAPFTSDEEMARLREIRQAFIGRSAEEFGFAGFEDVFNIEQATGRLEELREERAGFRRRAGGIQRRASERAGEARRGAGEILLESLLGAP